MENISQLQLLIDAITRSTSIEVLVTNTNVTKIVIPRESKLDNSLIVGIQAYNIDDASVLPVSALANVSNTVFVKSYITLQDSKSSNFIENLPLQAINKLDNAGKRYKLNYQIVNFENSYIQIPETTGVAANTGFFLMVDYIYLSDLQKQGINIETLLQRFK